MLLYYIRHGDPIYNPDSLTPLGKHQSEAVAKRLSVHGLDKIYSSTSNRAYETALPTSEILKMEIEKVDFFNEKYAWEYFSIQVDKNARQWIELIPDYRELFVNEEVTRLGNEWYHYEKFKNYKFKDGILFFEKQIDDFLLNLGLRHDRTNHFYKKVSDTPNRIAIFAHGGFGGIFLSSILDIPYPIFIAHHSLSHTGVTVIEFKEDNNIIIPKVLQFGNDSHLYKEGLPTKHCNKTFI